MTRITCIMMLCAFLPLWAQNPSNFEVEAGFQTVDHKDSLFPVQAENSFRSQYGLDEGLLIRTLRYDLSGGDSPGFLDNFRIEASGFGAMPHGYLRLRADKAKLFKLRLDYRAFDHFNTTSPVHRVDRTRQTMDMELTFLPRGTWQPYVGYRWSNYEGPATTTYHFGQDEFGLNSDLDEDDTEFRVGIRYQSEKIQAELMQGWRKFDGTEQVTGQGTGNTRPVLGEDIVLDSYSRLVEYNSDTPVTLANIRAYPHERIKLLGSYTKADADSETTENELFTGRFASFRIARFFNGGNASVRSKTESPSWRANLRAEVELGSGIDAGLGYSRRNIQLDGNALMETLYLDSVSFGGANQQDYLELMDAVTYMERDEDSIEADVTASLPHGFTLKAAYATTNEDITVDQALAEIVIRGGQEGVFERGLDRLTLSAGWKQGAHRILVEYRSEDADNAVMRTDFLNRDSLTIRGATGWKDKCLLTAVVRKVDSENTGAAFNSASGQNFDLLNQDLLNYSINLDLMPIKDLTLRFNYGQFDFDSQTTYLEPDFSTIVNSRYNEDSDNLGCEIDWKSGRFNLFGAYTGYDSDGISAWPNTLDNTRLRIGFDLLQNLTLRLEAARYEYENQWASYNNYETDVYGLLIHWRK